MSPAKSAKDTKVELKKWLGGAFASLACLARGDFSNSLAIDSDFAPVG